MLLLWRIDNMIVWVYLLMYGSIIGISWTVGFVLDKARAYKQAKLDLAQANIRFKELEAEKATWEEELETLAIDYSIMATLLEEHTTQLADVHLWMDEHDTQTNQRETVRIQIISQQAPNSMS